MLSNMTWYFSCAPVPKAPTISHLSLETFVLNFWRNRPYQRYRSCGYPLRALQKKYADVRSNINSCVFARRDILYTKLRSSDEGMGTYKKRVTGVRRNGELVHVRRTLHLLCHCRFNVTFWQILIHLCPEIQLSFVWYENSKN